MKRIVILAVLAFAALLAACVPAGPNCARLPGGAGYCLQTAEGIVPFEVQQKIDAVFNGQNETMIAQLEVDAAGMRLAVLTPMGQGLLQASFIGGEIRADGIALRKLDPAFLLAVIQLAYWDAGRLRDGLGGSAELVEGTDERTLIRDGQPVLRIGYTRGRPPTGGLTIGLPGMDVEFRMETLGEGCLR